MVIALAGSLMFAVGLAGRRLVLARRDPQTPIDHNRLMWRRPGVSLPWPTVGL